MVAITQISHWVRVSFRPEPEAASALMGVGYVGFETEKQGNSTWTYEILVHLSPEIGLLCGMPFALLARPCSVLQQLP